MKTSNTISAIAPALLKAQRFGHPSEEARLIRQILGRKEKPGRQHSDKPIWHRLLSNVVFGSSDCWNWSRVTNDFGYGRITYQGKTQVVHRLSYEAWNGPIPEGLSVLHSCDNPSCINPAHLHLGTYSDNIREAYQRGRRQPRGKK